MKEEVTIKTLIFEDEKQLADSFNKSFEAEGFESIVCYDHERGLDKISSVSNRANDQNR